MVRSGARGRGHSRAGSIRANTPVRVVFVGDFKNASCRSEKLARPRGRAFVEPCEGPPLPKGAL
eukprot:7609982-Pyramimonas_sp.AAC.1